MRNYDLTFILPSDLPEDELTGTVALVRGWVEEQKGTINKVDPWGRKKFAYSIGEYNEGFYFSFDCDLNPQNAGELERNIKLSGKVLRYLLIRKDPMPEPEQE
jgi:small subunit ribosomal protein S6